MAATDYFSSERVIFDDLAGRAARIAESVREHWNTLHRVEACAITWPKTALKADDGSNIERAVMCTLPPDLPDAQCLIVLQRMVERTKAYGLVVVLPKDDAIHVLFETHHGARAWLMRLERHGDVTVCLPPVVRVDAECIGLLWRPKQTN